MYIKLLEIAQSVLDLLLTFSNGILDFMMYEFEILGTSIPMYSILFGPTLIAFLTYKIARSLIFD